QGETALSYILLGVLAVMIARSGVTGFLIRGAMPLMRGKKSIVLFTIAALACLSQNLIPIHIAFIPILIPPLLAVFNKMKVDRRAIATALTFGLKAPYMLIPFGFGFLFQDIIFKEMKGNGLDIPFSQIPLAMAIPVGGMVLGLIFAILVTYRKPRDYKDIETEFTMDDTDTTTSGEKWQWKHNVTLLALLVTVVVQVIYDSLVLAALGGILVMFIFRAERWKNGDIITEGGFKMMGTSASVMLSASGYASVLKETGSVDELVETASTWIGGNQLLAAVVMMSVGFVLTIGIGTTFGTIPVIAAIFVPLGTSLGFSALAMTSLIGTAGAIGDAGSPASDSTLGPTSGLNVDGQHHRIWDTCVLTFLHYNIPLFIFGIVAAMIL